MNEHKGQDTRDPSHLPHGHRDRGSSHEQPRKDDKKVAEDDPDPGSDRLEDETPPRERFRR